MSTFNLLETINQKPNNLKFAALHSQIALELFLKYFYVTQNKTNEIQKSKKGSLIEEFKDFHQILNHFYSSESWSFGKKKDSVIIMENRNSIVHRGQSKEGDKELAKNIVKTLYFIHSTAWVYFNITILFDNYRPHEISKNKVWRDGVKSFVDDLADDFDYEVTTCLSCNAETVIHGESLVLDEEHTEDHFICLTCLTAFNTSHEAGVIQCYSCDRESYIFDALNEQENQMYVAKCTECETNTWVRKCKNCEEIYHPNITNEVKKENVFLCSKDCLDSYEDSIKNNGKRY
jgi:hypothetical protein